jgi:putative resolvase
VGLYARVSSHDRNFDLERQVVRLSEWSAKTGHRARKALQAAAADG